MSQIGLKIYMTCFEDLSKLFGIVNNRNETIDNRLPTHEVNCMQILCSVSVKEENLRDFNDLRLILSIYIVIYVMTQQDLLGKKEQSNRIPIIWSNLLSSLSYFDALGILLVVSF